MTQRYYLDHAATSPMRAPVLTAYVKALETVGNPASTHSHGQQASEQLETAREDIARHLGCEPIEVVFTSGGTESINLALKGGFWSRQRGRDRPVILVPEGEHHATLDTVEWLQDRGAEVVWMPINATGVLEASRLESEILRVGAERVALISFMWANNEVGSVQPVEELAAVAHAHEIPVHVDAVAALGQVPIGFSSSGVQYLSVSAHKIGGPPGVGALVIGRSAGVEPLLHGGSQQRGRSGTQDVAGAVGFAAALNTLQPVERNARDLAAWRDHLISEVYRVVPDAVLRGANPQQSEPRLPGNVHFTFPGCQGDSLLFLLDAAGVSVSVGSACQAGVQEVSHVLLAMGLTEEEAAGALRMTLGPDTDSKTINAFIEHLPMAVERAKHAGLT